MPKQNKTKKPSMIGLKKCPTSIQGLDEITERKRTEETIKRQLDEITSYYDYAPIGLAVLDTDLRFLRINNMLAEINGIPAGEHIGKTVKEIAPTLEVQASEVTSEIIRTGKPVTGIEFIGETAAQPGVKRTWLEGWYPLKGYDNKITGFTVIVQDITERKRNEEELNKSEERYRTLVESATQGVFVAQDGKLVFVNPMMTRMSGYSSEELLAKPFIEFIHPDDCEMVLDRHLKRLKGEEVSYIYPYRIIDRDGNIHWVELNAVLINWNEKTAVLGFLSDITERKRAEESLRESLNRFELLRAVAGDLLLTPVPQELVEALCQRVMEHIDCHTFFNFLVDEKSGRLYLNAYAGVPEDEAMRIKWLDYGVAVCGCVARDGCRIVVENIQTTSDPRTELVKSYGIRAYACHPLKGADGKVIGTLSFGTRTRETFSDYDLSLMKAVADQVAVAMIRVKTLKALRESESKLRRLYDSNIIGVIFWDTAGNIIEANNEFLKMVGYTKDELLSGKVRWKDMTPPEYAPLDEKALKELSDTGACTPFEKEYIRKDGSRVPILLGAAMLEGSEDKGICFVLDITDRKRAEAERGKFLHDLSERVKELGCINDISRLAEKPWVSIEEFVQQAVGILPPAWEYPEICCARIMLDSKEFKTANFRETEWSQSADIKVDRKKFGAVTICYLEEKPAADEGPFLKEERSLINTVADFLGNIIQHRLSEEELHNTYFTQSTINMILSESLQNITLEELLQKALNMILAIPWIAFETVGSISIVEDDADVLVMKAQSNIPEPLKKLCVRVPFGKCLCGKAAQTQKIEFADHIDERHEICYDGMHPHGHYSLPILFSGKTLGVLNIYLKEGHIRDKKEEDFLRTVADTLSGIIMRKKAEKRIEYLAYYDALTDLPNRNLFLDRLKQGIYRSEHTSKIAAVLITNIDRFNSINDTYGTEVGDSVLNEVAERLATAVRKGDTVARLGNDEFGIALLDVAHLDDVIPVMEKIMKYISYPLNINSNEIALTFSTGISIYPHDNKNPQDLLRSAGLALGIAKKEGRRACQFYTEDFNVKASEFLLMEKNLYGALQNEEFILHYQPYWDITTKKMVGMEALIRWQSKDKGLVPPGKFIPVLEDTGMIIEVGKWILREAMRQVKEWQNNGHPVVPVSVNMSLVQFRQKDLAEMVKRIMGECGFYPSLLTLEITESAFMQDIEFTKSVLTAMKDIGCSVSIDDFGTGYSSLAQLKRFPVDNLKIDISFIREMVKDPDSASIVMAIINMAHTLNLKTIAEGVETEEQWNFLRLLRCDMGQGFYLSKPLPAEEIERFFKKE